MSERSPSYPRSSLEVAVDLIGKIYEGAHTGSFDNESAFSMMGYSGKSGAALGALATLKQFGLVEGREPSLLLTELALRIVEPSDSGDRKRAIYDALSTPEAFRRILAEYPNNLPNDSIIRSRLVREFGFSAVGVKHFLQSLKESYLFARREGHLREEVGSPTLDEGKPKDDSSANRPTKEGESRILSETESAREAANSPNIVFPLSPKQSVTVRFSSPPEPSHVKFLISLLSLYLESME